MSATEGVRIRVVIDARLSWKVDVYSVHIIFNYLFSFTTFAVANPGEGHGARLLTDF